MTSSFRAQQGKGEYSKLRKVVGEMIPLQDSRAMREQSKESIIKDRK